MLPEQWISQLSGTNREIAELIGLAEGERFWEEFRAQRIRLTRDNTQLMDRLRKQISKESIDKLFDKYEGDVLEIPVKDIEMIWRADKILALYFAGKNRDQISAILKIDRRIVRRSINNNHQLHPVYAALCGQVSDSATQTTTPGAEVCILSSQRSQ